MIPAAAVTAWAVARAWPTPEQVEQDLLLSRAICEIAQHPYLGEELAFRGGTALHKLHLSTPLRYSEDLDYVRTTAGGIAELTHMWLALTELASNRWTFSRRSVPTARRVSQAHRELAEQARAIGRANTSRPRCRPMDWRSTTRSRRTSRPSTCKAKTCSLRSPASSSR